MEHKRDRRQRGKLYKEMIFLLLFSHFISKFFFNVENIERYHIETYNNRSGVEEVDEREIFKGSENRLSMFQTYTHKFFCRFTLHKYPFDEQVNILLFYM